MTLPEIEAMQAMLAQAAARHRAEEGLEEGAKRHRGPGLGAAGGEGRKANSTSTPTSSSSQAADSQRAEGHLKPCGEVEDLTGRDEPLERFNPEEDDWRSLGE